MSIHPLSELHTLVGRLETEGHHLAADFRAALHHTETLAHGIATIVEADLKPAATDLETKVIDAAKVDLEQLAAKLAPELQRLLSPALAAEILKALGKTA